MTSTEPRTADEGAPVEPELGPLYLIGGLAALLQLATVVAMAVTMVVLGPKPASAQAAFELGQRSPLALILRGDVLTMLLIALYLGTAPALYVALRRLSPVAMAFVTLFALIVVVLAFAGEGTMALLHLGRQYAAASGEAERAALLAAGEAVIASDIWHSTASTVAGILLQGGGVILSIVMLRSRDFGRLTAIAGLVGNAADLVQHLLHPFWPAVSEPIQAVMGIFYLVWFVMLARDLLRLARAARDAGAGAR
jgi:hypothetical protein